ncbi:hypothetical protein CCHR01_14657 [Colletotrichum chrysophilum]|uniref:Uncharacterized protein n=1 Tax=Colletotrichum chrysophilum TaxID=1836956 RepID=A0AAD9A7L5_9PEZI|nr:hypothetical protein CCHR01_14657 [Colletotrichum chrysophilum]
MRDVAFTPKLSVPSYLCKPLNTCRPSTCCDTCPATRCRYGFSGRGRCKPASPAPPPQNRVERPYPRFQHLQGKMKRIR